MDTPLRPRRARLARVCPRRARLPLLGALLGALMALALAAAGPVGAAEPGVVLADSFSSPRRGSEGARRPLGARVCHLARPGARPRRLLPQLDRQLRTALPRTARRHESDRRRRRHAPVGDRLLQRTHAPRQPRGLRRVRRRPRPALRPARGRVRAVERGGLSRLVGRRPRPRGLRRAAEGLLPRDQGRRTRTPPCSSAG